MTHLAEYVGHSYRERPVERWRDGTVSHMRDFIAEEIPVSLVFNGVPHVVMLATPLDIEDFALGFCLSEGLLDSPDELKACRVYPHTEGLEVRLRVAEDRAALILGRERNLTGRTGCGLCGAATLKQAIRHPAPVGPGTPFGTADLSAALENLRDYQTLNRITGAVHAAAWVVPGRGIVNVREDIGRHNALDKLIGTLARSRTDFSSGLALVTSRASFELVQKCASVGIATLAAISAPTALAVRLAEETGLTLIGFARDTRHVIYSHRWRLATENEHGPACRRTATIRPRLATEE
ncbi:MAG TPA: formate dehydrogenase accessory sulfurtransferase FdhD [Methylococcaceae bacterium]|nr:formate dehydrogenase accessory sulfurtransferase FdhD [Methylococcaceae bacterium]